MAVKLISKFRRQFNYKKRDLSWLLGLSKGFFKKARGARILIYHGICQKDHTKFNPIFLTYRIFEEHLRFYKKHFHLVSLEEYYTGQFSKDKYNVCITFDDGYANNFKYVLPLLEKYEVPISFFITAIRKAGYDILWNDFLGIVAKYGPDQLSYENNQFRKDKFGRYASVKTGITLVDYLKENGFSKKKEMMQQLKPLFKPGNLEDDYWLQMTEDEIKRLSTSKFVTIGSHGYFHNRMDKLTIESATEEMQASKQFLEGITGKEITSFAFPYGNYSRSIVEVAKDIGYKQLLAMDFFYPEDSNDPSLRERLTVNPFISVNNQMHAVVTGQYE